MIIFSCAIAGSDRISLETKATKIAKRHGKNLEIINLIDEMIKVGNKTNPYINSKNIPNLDIENIRLLKGTALKNIKMNIEENTKTDYIIDGHMSFWWRGGPLNLLNSKDLKALNPDFFISVLNDPNTVMARELYINKCNLVAEDISYTSRLIRNGLCRLGSSINKFV